MDLTPPNHSDEYDDWLDAVIDRLDPGVQKYLFLCGIESIEFSPHAAILKVLAGNLANYPFSEKSVLVPRIMLLCPGNLNLYRLIPGTFGDMFFDARSIIPSQQ